MGSGARSNMQRHGKRRMRVPMVVAALAAAGLVGAGCGGDSNSGDSGGGEGGGGTASDALVIAIPGTPQGVDLDRQSGPQTWTMAAQVLEQGADWVRIEYPYDPPPIGDPTQIPGFTYPAIEEQEIEYGIIESCDLNEDATEATYHLREGVMTHDGEEFTADDVLYRVERALANEAIGTFMLDSANAADRDQWEKVDKYTVRITNDTPMALICKINANLYWLYIDSETVKKNATEEDPWANEFVSTNGASFGPYHITRWQSGRQVVMEANENYWAGPPSIKRIVWTVVPESSNRVALLQSGQVDMAEGLSPEQIASLDGTEGVNAAAVRSSLSLYAVLNNKEEPFSDPKVRQAINYAIPRDDIVNQVYSGAASPWQGVFPSIYPGHVEMTRYEQDLERAKQLLSEAGYDNGFQTSIAFSAGDPVQEQVAVLMQTSLREIGVRAQLQKQPPAAHSDLVQSKTAEFAFWLDFPIQPDPNYSLRLLYDSESAINYQNYDNKNVDDLIQEGNELTEQTDRNEFSEQIQQIVSEEAALGWITEPFYLMGLRDNIENWGWYTTQHYLVKTLEKK